MREQKRENKIETTKTRELVKGGATWCSEPVLSRGPAPLQEVVGQVFPHFGTAHVIAQAQGEIHRNFSAARGRLAELGDSHGPDLAAELGHFGELVVYLKVCYDSRL